MKSIGIISIILILTMPSLSAQNSTKTIQKDTINLRGYIYDTDGKPVKWLMLQSKQLDLTYNQYPLSGTTDTAGYFEIKGAKPIDTLTITTKHLFYPKLPVYYNKGSRYMVIYLPQAANQINITPDAPVIVSHKRIINKKLPSFEIVKNTNNSEGDYFDVHVFPQYKGYTTKDGFKSTILTLVEYPDKALKNNIEGTVKISFDISLQGIPTNFKTLNGIGYGCDEEVINAIKKAGKWRPAIDNGRPLLVTETISVEFKLTNK